MSLPDVARDPLEPPDPYALPGCPACGRTHAVHTVERHYTLYRCHLMGGGCGHEWNPGEGVTAGELYGALQVVPRAAQVRVVASGGTRFLRWQLTPDQTGIVILGPRGGGGGSGRADPA